MPRSFLVKKNDRVKVHEKDKGYRDKTEEGYRPNHIPKHPLDLTVRTEPMITAIAPYTPSLTPLAVRLSNGE